MNPYIPYPVVIDRITAENDAADLKTFRLRFKRPEDRERFALRCGQFAELSLLGHGEAPIGIASSPLDADYVEFTVKRYATGVVTTALHQSDVGREMGLRGPLGNGYPIERFAGKNLVIISGGFAVTTLRSTLRYLLHPDIRDTIGDITVVYGARSPGELCYKSEFLEWQARADIAVHLTVDKGDATWSGREGFVPAVVEDVRPSAENAICLICGPPIMLKFTIPVLRELGFGADDTYLSFEMRMKCGIGKCGRCNIGSRYVCVDGPVFSLAEVDELPTEY
ncbi:MAG: FAD/NAD(P)-binding protein [Lentisphaerae bacterium]|jgi:sulfhydrogenase subunit gamma (sulfur reductase)|nr:FAD/NAD(P)-binding protein [Lentisphaerota bacterium]MBT4820056.1 FAD/NAD(P)-binding protein [Lentisphaerota bacterium]MBT5606285.1 FAD/NAD(P)-binding protein [Lentisphaerota bacterium]MBT7059375.1 FAD/NAD(P)-binding protein [Lentisphaerota bacterium]MBT7848270.1 FAD/NAD(P)-binding protein [Lentisphaerota bacterium]